VEVTDSSHTSFDMRYSVGDRLLKESFPELFCLARNTDAMVANLRSVSNDMAH
jgi:hypothetical protein